MTFRLFPTIIFQLSRSQTECQWSLDYPCGLLLYSARDQLQEPIARMALITIVGFPCSGKTTRAKQIKEYLESRLRDPAYDGPRLSVLAVDDENSHVPRSTYDSKPPLLYYSDSLDQYCQKLKWGSLRRSGSKEEKPGRANIFSSVTRNLTPETIVICDSLNYIKGFRYQMYCASREANCRVCTVSPTSPKCLQYLKHEDRVKLDQGTHELRYT